MYQRLKKVEEPRVGNSDELLSQKVTSPYRHGVSSHPASVPEMTRVYKPLVSAPMKSNNFLDTDQGSQLYMGSLDSNDSYRPFPIMRQKRVVAGIITGSGRRHAFAAGYIGCFFGPGTIWNINSMS